MSISLDAHTGQTDTDDTVISHTIGALNNSVLIAVVNMESGSDGTIDSVIFDEGGPNEHTLILVSQANQGSGFVNRSAIFVALDADLPGSGTFNVTVNVTLASSPGLVFSVSTWSDVSQSIPTGSQIDNANGSSVNTLNLAPNVAVNNSLSIAAASVGQDFTIIQPTGYTLLASVVALCLCSFISVLAIVNPFSSVSPSVLSRA